MKQLQLVEKKEIEKPKFHLVEAFAIPERDWETLIEYYNSNNRQKFKLKPIQCKEIINHVKLSIPPQYMFKVCGYNYNTFNSKYQDMLDRVDILNSKSELTEIESDERCTILTHPLFVLMSDIDRAEGAAAIEDFNTFNEKSKINTELLPFKMKARYKEIFGDKKDDSGVVNINIQLGGDFIDDI